MRTQNTAADPPRLSVTSTILLILFGLILGWLVGAVTGFALGYPFAMVKGWDPSSSAVRAAVSCIVIGIPTGLIGSCIALFFRSNKLTGAVFVICGTFIALLMFLAYAENGVEVWHSFLYGAIVGPIIGLGISAGYIPLRRFLARRSNRHRLNR